MTIVEIHAGPRKPATFFSSREAAARGVAKRNGPFEFHAHPSGRWFVVRRIDRHILCRDGRWRYPFKVAL